VFDSSIVYLVVYNLYARTHCDASASTYSYTLLVAVPYRAVSSLFISTIYTYIDCVTAVRVGRVSRVSYHVDYIHTIKYNIKH
jgi:hypothetical protein